MMRVLDLFSGIGAFSIGLERVGMTTVGFCEIDPFCRQVLAKHWPNVPCHDDITTREFEEGEADVITAGFPCQDISLAGTGAGLAGERSGLFREVVRAIRLVRPRFTVLENVAALLHRGMGEVLGNLAESGNDAQWDCVSACECGAPHTRERMLIVAYPQSDNGQERLGLHAQLEKSLPPEHDETRKRAWLATEPKPDGMVDGLSSKMDGDRVHALGNSILPQKTEIIGRAILSSTRNQEEAA